MELLKRHREAFKKYRWSMEVALDTEDGGVIIYRCEKLKVSKVVRTPKVKGQYGEQEVVYVIDGGDREFTSIADVAVALEEKGSLPAK